MPGHSHRLYRITLPHCCEVQIYVEPAPAFEIVTRPRGILASEPDTRHTHAEYKGVYYILLH